MNDMTHENRDDQKTKQRYSSLDNYLVDINELTNEVIAVATSVKRALIPGVPKSVYQLKLFNYLIKKGFQLETEASMLNDCVNNEPERELLIVNGMLIIECIVDINEINHHQKRIVFDLQNNGHVMGLLINFNTDMQNIGVTRVYPNFGIH